MVRSNTSSSIASSALPTIIRGDSCDPRTIQEALQPRRFDLLLTDPPVRSVKLLSEQYMDRNIRTIVMHNSAPRFSSLLGSIPQYCLLERRRALGSLRDPKGRKNEATGRFESVVAYRQFTHAWMTACAPHCSNEPSATWVIWTNFLGRAPILETAAGLGFAHLAGEFVWAKRPSAVRRVPTVHSSAQTATTCSLDAANPALRRLQPQPASLVSHVVAGGSGEVQLSVVEFALVVRRTPLPPLALDSAARCWSVVAGSDDGARRTL